MSSQTFIPFHLPSIGDEVVQEVEAALRSGWLTAGPRTAQFEKDFSAYVDSPYALALNSCTAGLHVALAALGIGKGDEVITTPLTFCSTVHTISHTGATPVLADVGVDGNIDPEAIERAITPRTRAIIPVHLAGLPCEMNAIWDKLYPAFQSEALPENPEGVEKLKQSVATLAAHPAKKT